MNIVFRWIEYKNILSVGASPIRIQLDESDKTLITGHNGAGKSTMIEALSFMMYGKSYRKLKKEQLINSINKKNLLVTGELTIDGKLVHIERGIKPNVFRVTVDGEPIDETASVAEYQRILEEDILNFSHESFKQLIVLGKAGYTPFMELKPEQRRTMVEDLLELSVLGEMNKKNNVELKQINDKTTVLDVEVNGLENERSSIIKSLEDQKKQNEESILSQTNQVRSIVEKVKVYKDSLELTKGKLDALVYPDDSGISLLVDQVKLKYSDEKNSLISSIAFTKEEVEATKNEYDSKIQSARTEVVDEKSFLDEIENLRSKKVSLSYVDSKIKELESSVFDKPKPEDTRKTVDQSIAEELHANSLAIAEKNYIIKDRKSALDKFVDGKCPTCGSSTDSGDGHSHIDNITSEMNQATEDLQVLIAQKVELEQRQKDDADGVRASVNDYNHALDQWNKEKKTHDLGVSDAIYAVRLESSNTNNELDKQIVQVQTRLDSISGETQRKVNALESEKSSKLVQLERTLNDLQMKLDRIDLDMEKEILTVKEDFQKQVDDFNKTKYDLESTISSLESSISDNTDIAKTIKVEIDKLKEKVFTSERLSEINTALIEKGDIRGELFNEKYCRGIIKDMLKDDGVKAVLVKKYLPKFNEKINEYLAITGADYVFSLDESFEESIKSRGREEFSYMSFSQGEKARIDIALLFTWRYIASKVSGTNISMLVLDEIFDGGMDAEGVYAVNRLLAEIGGNTFIISHRVENRDDSFTSHIRMTKKGRFTVMERE